VLDHKPSHYMDPFRFFLFFFKSKMVYATSHQKVYFFTLQRFSTNFDLDDQKSFALYLNILISDTSVSTNLILNHEGMIVDRILLNICREILVWRGYLPLVFLVLRISTRFSCASSLLGCYFSHLLWQYCFAWLSFVLSATCFWDLDFANVFWV